MKLLDAFFTDDHLHIICSEPTENGSVAVLNFTSREEGKDLTCVVRMDEYAGLTNESVIAYKFGALFSEKAIERLELLGAQRYPSISEDLLLRIQQGALNSRKTRPEVKNVIRDAMASARAKRHSQP